MILLQKQNNVFCVCVVCVLSLHCFAQAFLWLWQVGATLHCGARAFSLPWFLLLWSAGSRAFGHQQLCTGLVATWHVGSSWTGDRTHVSCIGKWVLYH